MLGVMTTAQRYVSKELSHFAGAGKAEADQYDILLRILRSGELRHGGRVDSDIPNPGGISSHAPGIVRFDPTRLVTRHESVVPEAVCFCDIPVEDLELHTSKYSRFGLSFVKEFLLPKGASPVFYVAANARTVTREAAGGKRARSSTKRSPPTFCSGRAYTADCWMNSTQMRLALRATPGSSPTSTCSCSMRSSAT